ncbi:uncharacterized protein RJT20DRAFT_14493 [Scheffersomyces xylosifermentans]|uniref:uncharacterized protein n=1 Tax=Scheffersomyces xylosifermentans TaxID=1304137 RepID=UPI00315CC6EC
MCNLASSSTVSRNYPSKSTMSGLPKYTFILYVNMGMNRAYFILSSAIMVEKKTVSVSLLGFFTISPEPKKRFLDSFLLPLTCQMFFILFLFIIIDIQPSVA